VKKLGKKATQITYQDIEKHCLPQCRDDPTCYSFQINTRKDQKGSGVCHFHNDYVKTIFGSLKHKDGTYKDLIYFCNEPKMKNSGIVFGNAHKCKVKCGFNKWCKSFDYCHEDENNTFCHLKDMNREDFRKPFMTFEYGYQHIYKDTMM